MNSGSPFSSGRPVVKRIVAPPATLFLFLTSSAWGLTIDSVRIDRVNEKIIVKGEGFDVSTGFTLAGVSVPTANVSAAQLDIPFGAEVASAVRWRGSYKLNAAGTVEFSVYFEAPIDDPSPPPPPPPGGTTCPCIEGWDASGIPKDNWTFCIYNEDGTQQSTSGLRDPYFISAAFDPNDISFDPVDPGNSVSYCALHDRMSWSVAEPVVNQDEFDHCDQWLWRYICF